MAKSNGATRKPQTHFEQVPIEMVKKVVDPNASKDKKARAGTKPTSRKKG